MKITKDRNLIVYYYTDISDLIVEEKLFVSLQINLNYIGETIPIKICPRGKNNYHILLWNSGNKENDLKKLNNNLSKFNLEFHGEL